MKHYLKEELVNHSLDSIRNIIEYFPHQDAQGNLYRIYRELKLYSNNEFAFKEVYNEELFNENAKFWRKLFRFCNLINSATMKNRGFWASF